VPRRGLALLLMLAGVAAAAEPAPTVLTHIAEVKASPAGSPAQPVRLRGVITVSLGNRSGAFLQDETGGIFVSPKKPQPTFLRAGDWVECTGWTAAGQYAPMIVPDQIEYLGRKEIPAPLLVNLGEFATGRHDGEWVEATGVVRTLVLKPDTRPELQLAVGRERLRVQICDVRGIVPEGLIDAEIRVAGVASGFFNRDRQLLMPVLFAPDWIQVVVTRPAPGDPFNAALRSTTSLFRYAPDEQWGHMARVRGTVTHYLPGKAIFIRDDDGPLHIETTESAPLKVGDVIEAAGFPAVRQGAAYLQDSLYRVVGRAPVPPAVPADPTAIGQGLIRPSERIAMEGILVEARQIRDKSILTLRSGEQTFDVQVETAAGAPVPALPAIDSRVRVTGVLWTEDIDPRSRHIVPTLFRVLSPSMADVAILDHPSWWTRARLAQVVVTLLVAIMAAVVWIWLLRQRVGAQMSTIAEKVAREAVAEERARTACEIHDTLAQGFMALGFQLEALSGELKDPAPPVRQHLDRAMKMLRHSHDEVRYSLKQLRGPAVERKDLPAALREAVERAPQCAQPQQVHFTVRGTSFPLLPATEHNLVRIGQEAATNAVKHGGARHIAVELAYEPGGVALCVKDDGTGFEPARPNGGGGDHFGLEIMRERAQRIGGTLDIRSRPGAGTTITLVIPRAISEKTLPRVALA
jgi:signal transduction histidine kinase